MNTGLYIAFVVAAALLIVSPGPTVMLITSVSLRRGVRAGLIAVAGSTLAAALQLAVVVAGLASVVSVAGHGFEWIRWLGVGYLVYLGLTALLYPAAAGSISGGKLPGAAHRQHVVQGFVVTLTNPKTLLFHSAFLPQFIDPALPQLQQMLILASSFVLIAGLGDSAWAILAGRVGETFASAGTRRLVDRISGSVLLCAAVALATVRRVE
jgi:threonine/homoserine/homoserine lactone efflux protein